jgi:hypothetical protein
MFRPGWGGEHRQLCRKQVVFKTVLLHVELHGRSDVQARVGCTGWGALGTGILAGGGSCSTRSSSWVGSHGCPDV